MKNQQIKSVIHSFILIFMVAITSCGSNEINSSTSDNLTYNFRSLVSGKKFNFTISGKKNNGIIECYDPNRQYKLKAIFNGDKLIEVKYYLRVQDGHFVLQQNFKLSKDYLLEEDSSYFYYIDNNKLKLYNNLEFSLFCLNDTLISKNSQIDVTHYNTNEFSLLSKNIIYFDKNNKKDSVQVFRPTKLHRNLLGMLGVSNIN